MTVPVGQACWDDSRQIRLWVPYPRAQAWASPAVDENTLDNPVHRTDIEDFYAVKTAHTTDDASTAATAKPRHR